MKFVELASFDVTKEGLGWPWLAFDPARMRFAFVTSESRIATRLLGNDGVEEGPSFPLPSDVTLPSLQGYAIDATGTRVAFAAAVAASSFVVTSDEGGERCRSTMETLAGPGISARAITFDRSGTRLWISGESATETVVALVDATTHSVLGVARSPVLPPPAMHELYVHPQDDAVLLLAACGQDGTFARVVGWSGERVEAVPTSLDEGGIPAGFAGFSADAARVHLVEADELRTHAWPSLHELSSVDLADDFVSSYAGAVLGSHVYIDGADADSQDDEVMRFDRSGIRGMVMNLPVPTGMWAGALGTDVIVTVESKGEPARGRVLRIALPDTSN